MVIDFSRHDNPDIAGIADILILKNGKYVWIEFKRPGNKQQENQIEFQNAIKNRGGIYIIIRSLDELMDFLGDDEIQGELF